MIFFLFYHTNGHICYAVSITKPIQSFSIIHYNLFENNISYINCSVTYPEEVPSGYCTLDSRLSQPDKFFPGTAILIQPELHQIQNSKLRTFLNGLGADENAAKFDCKDKGMLQLMFTEDERSYLIAVDTTNGTNDLMTVPSVEDVSGDLGYAHGFYKKKSAESNMRKTFTTDFAGTSFESPLLRNDPKKSSSSNTLLVYQISTQGDITTIFQDYTLGVLPMVKVSLDCPSLQKVEDEE